MPWRKELRASVPSFYQKGIQQSKTLTHICSLPPVSCSSNYTKSKRWSTSKKKSLPIWKVDPMWGCCIKNKSSKESFSCRVQTSFFHPCLCYTSNSFSLCGAEEALEEEEKKVDLAQLYICVRDLQREIQSLECCCTEYAQKVFFLIRFLASR